MNIFRKLLDFSWLILLVVLVITAGFLYMIKTGTHLETNLDKYMPAKNPAFVYSTYAEDLFNIRDGIIVAVENSDGIFNPGTLKKIKDLTKDLQKLKGIDKEDVTSLYTADNIVGSEYGMEVNPFYSRVPKRPEKLQKLKKEVESNDMIFGRIVSRDEHSAVVIARIKRDVFDAAFYNKVLAIAHSYEGPEKIYVAGRPIVEGTLGKLMPQDMKRMAPLVILVIIIVLLIILRSVKGMLLNLTVVLLSTIWTFGLMAVFKIPVYSVSTLIPVMLIAIGVAYGIHLFNHLELFLEKNPRAEKRDAIIDTVRSMWRPVLMAAVTTAVGFLSLLTSQVYPVKYFGIFTAFGVMSAMLFALVLIPAGLVLFGLPKTGKFLGQKKLNRGKKPFSHSFTEGILNHKFMVIAVTAAIAGISLFGLTRVWIDSSFLANFEASSPIRQTDTFINDHFAGTSSFNVILEGKKTDTFKNPEVLKLTDDLQRDLGKLHVVGDSFSLTDFMKRMNMVMNEDNEKFNTIPGTKDTIAQYLLLYEMSGDPENLNSVIDYTYKTMNLTVQLKSDDSKSIRSVISVINGYRSKFTDLGISINFAGSGYKALVFSELILKGQVTSLFLSVVIVIILLTLMFKNIRIGLIGSIPILLTSIVNFGVMGLLKIPLGPTTALISSIAVGIGIDYAIHFIERYKEYALTVPDKLEVSRMAMFHSGRAILFNAVVVISGFLVFLFSIFPPNRELGALVSLNMFTSFVGTLTIMFLLLYISNIYFSQGEKK